MVKTCKDVEPILKHWNLGREMWPSHLEAVHLGERAGLSEEELSKAREVLKAGLRHDLYVAHIRSLYVPSFSTFFQHFSWYVMMLVGGFSNLFWSWPSAHFQDLDGRDQAEHQLREAIKRRLFSSPSGRVFPPAEPQVNASEYLKSFVQHQNHHVRVR